MYHSNGFLKLKEISESEPRCIFKARRTLRGDLRKEGLNYDVESLYAPVVAHESICMLVSLAASRNLHLEGFDISDNYTYGNIDASIIMKQATD